MERAKMNIEKYQTQVREWVVRTFGEEIADDILERCDRFTEESLELVQSLGHSRERAHALVDYVFDRPIGDPFQELGGTAVTLAALAEAAGLSIEICGVEELNRCWTKMDAIREKQKNKPQGSALPQ